LAESPVDEGGGYVTASNKANDQANPIGDNSPASTGNAGLLEDRGYSSLPSSGVATALLCCLALPPNARAPPSPPYPVLSAAVRTVSSAVPLAANAANKDGKEHATEADSLTEATAPPVEIAVLRSIAYGTGSAVLDGTGSVSEACDGTLGGGGDGGYRVLEDLIPTIRAALQTELRSSATEAAAVIADTQRLRARLRLWLAAALASVDSPPIADSGGWISVRAMATAACTALAEHILLSRCGSGIRSASCGSPMQINGSAPVSSSSTEISLEGEACTMPDSVEESAAVLTAGEDIDANAPANESSIPSGVVSGASGEVKKVPRVVAASLTEIERTILDILQREYPAAEFHHARCAVEADSGLSFRVPSADECIRRRAAAALWDPPNDGGAAARRLREEMGEDGAGWVRAPCSRCCYEAVTACRDEYPCRRCPLT
jgi:hypothetical protein